MVEKLVPDTFLKNLNWAYLRIYSLKFYTFYCMASWGLSKYIEVKLRTLAFTKYQAFLKNKEVWNYSPCLIFCIIFEEKYFYYLYSINWPNFIVCLPLLCEICSCYRTVPGVIWEIFSEFLIFCNLFHEPLGEWNNNKIWETRKVSANVARGNVR